jgi:hypothetical protein
MPEHINAEDYNRGHAPGDLEMKVELAINERAEAIIFHNKAFPHELSWLEFNLDDSRLSLIMNNGEVRDFGIPVRPELSRYMQNAFQVLMVQMDEASGEPIEGGYIPLIIHRE